MSVETAFAALEGASAAPVVPPAASPTAQEPTPEVQQPAEGQPTVEQPETPTPEAAEPEVETEPNLEEAPESSGDFGKYKPLFKDHPELRNIIGREKAYSELGNFSEVREVIQRIPSVADAEQLVADSENKRLLGQTFREDVPTFVESLKESDPLAFQKFATDLPEVLRESDPQLWSQQAKSYTDTVLNNVLLIAQQEGDQALYDAVQLVAARGLQTRLGQQAAPIAKPNSELARLRQELDQRKQAESESAFNSFWNQTDEVVMNDALTNIKSTITKAVPQASPVTIQKMVKDAYDKTLELLNQQPQTIAQIQKFRNDASRGKQGIAEHKAIVSYISGRAKLVIPNATKAVINEWSGEILKFSQDKTDKQKAIAAKTKDVGTGPQGTTSAANGAPPKTGQQRHVKDVLAELAAGTYVKR
jgi:hypothetical protein